MSDSDARSRQDRMLALFAHQGLFNEIANKSRPEADIRQRFYDLRAIRASDSEASLKAAGVSYYEFMNDLGNKNIAMDSKHAWKKFKAIMRNLDRELSKNSRIYDEDSRAANAPLPDQFIMDNTFRHITHEKGPLAPNGGLLVEYGSYGEPVNPGFATVRGSEIDFFRGIILDKVFPGLQNFIFLPCWKYFNKVLGRGPVPEPQGLHGRTLELVVVAVECTTFVACVACFAALLVNIKSFKNRIIATGFSSLILPYSAIFFSSEAKMMFMLTLSFWAVMAVFLSASGSAVKSF